MDTFEFNHNYQNDNVANMHELFLTTTVDNAVITRACQVLQGYCAMSPVTILRRRLVWKAPQPPNNHGINPVLIDRSDPRTQQNTPMWKSLNEQLLRQPYVVVLQYEHKKEQFREAVEGVENTIVDCDQLPGTLSWAEVPEPGEKKQCNSRLAITIEGEKGLCALFQAANYTFSAEMIEETHQFVHSNVILTLSRYLTLPSLSPSTPDEKIYNRSLPSYESLTPFDPENKWICTAKVRLSNGTDQEQMAMGLGELMGVKNELEGCFNLKVVDRLVFDTRVR